MNKYKFDDWNDVKDCNSCETYWNNQCDGTSVGIERPCRGFKATRNVDIPNQLNNVEKAVQRLNWMIYIIAVSLLVHYIDYLGVFK